VSQAIHGEGSPHLDAPPIAEISPRAELNSPPRRPNKSITHNRTDLAVESSFAFQRVADFDRAVVRDSPTMDVSDEVEVLK